MPTASQRVLLNFFHHDPPFTPTPGRIEQFERDLKLVSPSLMKAALKEARAGRALLQGGFAEQRAAIFQAYYRKVAEHAQLFPTFHAIEGGTMGRPVLACITDGYAFAELCDLAHIGGLVVEH